MHSLFLYLTASALSIHNLANNIKEATGGGDLEPIILKTLPTNWTLSDKICHGSKQSPIDIEISKAQERNLRLSLTAYDKPIQGFLVNAFPTFQLMPFSFQWPSPNAVVWTSSSLARFIGNEPDRYRLHNVQFFWPSMHRVEGEEAPLEIQFIHFNEAYSSLEEALTKEDGLLAFAVMVAPSTHESYVFDKFLDELVNITEHGQQVLIDEETSWRSLLPVDTSRFFRYFGSLVLPPCNESVQWIVFEEKLKLGQKQLRRLRTRHKFVGRDLRSNKEVDWSNQRPKIQPLNNRFIERSLSYRVAKRTR